MEREEARIWQSNPVVGQHRAAPISHTTAFLWGAAHCCSVRPCARTKQIAKWALTPILSLFFLPFPSFLAWLKGAFAEGCFWPGVHKRALSLPLPLPLSPISLSLSLYPLSLSLSLYPLYSLSLSLFRFFFFPLSLSLSLVPFISLFFVCVSLSYIYIHIFIYLFFSLSIYIYICCCVQFRGAFLPIGSRMRFFFVSKWRTKKKRFFPRWKLPSYEDHSSAMSTWGCPSMRSKT